MMFFHVRALWPAASHSELLLFQGMWTPGPSPLEKLIQQQKYQKPDPH